MGTLNSRLNGINGIIIMVVTHGYYPLAPNRPDESR